MDHDEQRQRRSPRGNAPGSGSSGASPSSRKPKVVVVGGRKPMPIKVVHISNPMRVKTSAAGFRALVQELTGRHADPSKYIYNNHPEDPSGGSSPAAAAADHLPDDVDAAPQGKGCYDDEEEEEEDPDDNGGGRPQHG